MWAQEQQFPWISELSLYPSLCICTWANRAAAVTRGQGQRRGTHNANSQCKDMATGSNPLEDPTFSLPSPFSDEARLSGSSMIKTESSNPFYYWKHNIYSLFHTYFSGSKEIFPLCLTSCGHDRCLKLEVPLSEETHTWNSKYIFIFYIFQKLACKNSHISTNCQVRSLHSTCPNSPSQFT